MSPRGHQPAERDAPQTSDAELMQQLAKGQLGALGELYDRYQAGLRSFLGRATRDSHDVDDLLHATFLAAAKTAERYDGRSSCRPWLVGIAAQLLRRRRHSGMSGRPIKRSARYSTRIQTIRTRITTG